MTLLLPKSARTKTRKKVRTLRGVKLPRGVAKSYWESLDAINNVLKDTLDPVNQLINNDASPSRIADEIQRQSDNTQAQVNIQAPIVAASFVAASNRVNKERIQKTIQSAFSIDIARIIDDENLSEALQAAVVENVSLIKSIPQQFWGDITQAVMANFRGQNQVGGISLQQRIKEIGDISDNRARFIARDQTGKLNADFTRLRHQNIGINTYIWRGTRTIREVGNPVGLYPKGNKWHGDHWSREGKKFSYDNPPSDGNPGMAPNCQCWAEAIVDIDDIDVLYSL